MPDEARGQSAIVTATSPNIGGGTAEALAAEVAALVCVDARPDNAMEWARYVARGRSARHRRRAAPARQDQHHSSSLAGPRAARAAHG
jgi:NAD(P)-dependent dehydrogenase (short-subunit alcohol dehydrogenase family)